MKMLAVGWSASLSLRVQGVVEEDGRQMGEVVRHGTSRRSYRHGHLAPKEEQAHCWGAVVAQLEWVAREEALGTLPHPLLHTPAQRHE